MDHLKSTIWDEIDRRSINNKIIDGFNLKLKGLPGSLKTLFLVLLNERLSRPLLVIMPSQEEAESTWEELAGFMKHEKVLYFPGGDEDPESPIILNPRRVAMQMKTTMDLLSQRGDIVVTSPEGIIHGLPSPEDLKKDVIEFSEGRTINLYQVVERLIELGYTRENLVERPGEISMRGGILDIFPLTGEKPYRLEFWGDTVESMRTFDISSQRSTGKATTLRLISTPIAWRDRSSSLFHFFRENLILFIQDPDLVLARAEKEYHKDKQRSVPIDRFNQLISQYQTLSYHTLYLHKGVIDVGGKPIGRPGTSADEIRKYFYRLLDTHHELLIVVERTGNVERMASFLNLGSEPITGLHMIKAPVHRGFDLETSGIAIFTERDIFGKLRKRKRPGWLRQGVPIRELSSLKRGDFVVHVDYGIGKYRGLEKISVSGAERECLAILYQDGDKLYVPLDKIERVQKYSGRDGREPNITKLGSGSWEKLKRKTKRSVKDIAKDLIAIYSARKRLAGMAFSPDTQWQKDLEATFPYDETPDQLHAIADVKRDMEQSRPMDRLVCGDVGYGKTEVAVRAAFKAVSDNKQVVLMAPTTILVQQHYRTFSDRLSRFPITIDVLSRFRSKKEQTQIVEQLKTGGVDIIIGTHRLLSRDVGFKDLGLLIIDEEQRFGVRHKEKLKTLRKTVDVLTLSATPIPRTLHFSMMGIRDMSLIHTPPKDRLPIITEVSVFDESVIVEAIEREMSRDGQVFFVHNRIQSIEAVARMIKRLVPDIRIAVAHGRMEPRELEKVMIDFNDGGYDCLVATMIIESGLDMPNVNTLIVHRADQLGLAQLYQLRGRVGRSDKRAYAYLLTLPLHLLSQEAIKRLRTIEEFTELGSGFQIALRDLEIRGAGNLLGVQQSGYMDAVGFDLYTKLVDEAVHELKLEDEGLHAGPKPLWECIIENNLPAYLPTGYVEDESIRVNLYRHLSAVRQEQEADNFIEELRDRFGPLPKEAENLIEIVKLKLLAQEKGIGRIVINETMIFLFFASEWIDQFSESEPFSEWLRKIIDSSLVPIRFLNENEFGLCFSFSGSDSLAVIKKMLQSWE